MPDACFVLLNPDLDDTILSYTFGITISDRVRKFVRQFDTCYYYRGTFQMVRPSNARTHARTHAHTHTHTRATLASEMPDAPHTLHRSARPTAR